MSPTTAFTFSDLIYLLRQHFNLSQERFAAKLGVFFNIVNRWEKGRSLPSPMAQKLIKELLNSIGEPGKNLLEQCHLEGGSDV